MRTLKVAAAIVLVCATPALADTLQEVTTRGAIVTVSGMDIDVKYTPDGKFTALDGQLTGEWRIDGDKLCAKSNFDPQEKCTIYPKGKKSGDSFEVTGPQGAVMVKIK